MHCTPIPTTPLFWLNPVVALLLAATSITATATSQDPTYAAFVASTEQRLAKHPFLGPMLPKFIRVTKHEPFVFFLKQPDAVDTEYESKIVNGYRPFLSKLLSVFETQYVGPANLQRHESAGGYAFVILHSKGDYMNYAQKLRDESMHIARAHYDPDLRCAVTYEDTYGTSGRINSREARHAVLHEFVHALQHAYCPTGAMPRSPWLLEGLAEHRSTCDNLAESLLDPPIWHEQLGLTYHAWVGDRYQPWRCSLQEMAKADSYGAVLKAVESRLGPSPAQGVLALFYAQSEMFCRFLHESDGGSRRDAFLGYLAACLAGKDPSAEFERCFLAKDAPDWNGLEDAFKAWLSAKVDGSPEAQAEVKKGASSIGPGGAASPLPTPFDLSRLQWKPSDLAIRTQGAARLAASGDFIGAIEMLPTDEAAEAAQRPSMQRWRTRYTELHQFRASVAEDLVKARRPAPKEFGAGAKYARIQGEDLVVTVAGTERHVPIRSMTPATLIEHAKRMKWIGDGRSVARAREALLRWLDGSSLPVLQPLLDGSHGALTDLREDLNFVITKDTGAEASLLGAIQKIGMPDAQPDAAKALQAAEETIRTTNATLGEERMALLRDWLTALAERAFDPKTSVTQTLPGTQMLADGRIRCVVEASSKNVGACFRVSTVAGFRPEDQERTAFAGPVALTPREDSLSLAGPGAMEFACPLGGNRAIEIEFTPKEDFSSQIVLTDAAQGGTIIATWGGQALISSRRHGVDGESVGGAAPLFTDKRLVIRVEFDDGKHIRILREGKETTFVPTKLRFGDCRLLLYSWSSSRVIIHKITVEGSPIVGDIGAARDTFVQTVLARLTRK
jgi:hypothetical protein